MSLVIAIKDKKRFVLGADKQVSGWNNKSHSGTKIWQTEYKGCCIGSVGTLRGAQVIQYIKGLLDSAGFGKDELDDAFIHLQLPRTLYETLKMHGVVIDDPTKEFELPNSFFIAYLDRCWKINHDLSVEEVEDYDAIGSGADVAIGVIETAVLYKEKNPYRIITNAIDIAAEKTLYVDHEIEFVETITTKSDIIDKASALGYDTSLLKKAVNKDGSIDLEKLTKLAFEIKEPKPTEAAKESLEEIIKEEKTEVVEEKKKAAPKKKKAENEPTKE